MVLTTQVASVITNNYDESVFGIAVNVAAWSNLDNGRMTLIGTSGGWHLLPTARCPVADGGLQGFVADDLFGASRPTTMGPSLGAAQLADVTMCQ